MPIVYVDRQGSKIRKRNGALCVEKEGERVAEVPGEVLDRVIIVGNIGITTPALALFFDSGVPVSFLTSRGRYRGRLATRAHKNCLLRLRQFEKHGNAAFRLGLARAFALGKMMNQRVFLSKHGRNYPEKDIAGEAEEIRKISGRLERASSVSEIMGLEGIASRAYFRGFGRLVRGEFSFEKRTRRPPRDPVNGLLSLGYTLLTGEIESALEAVGLDPYIGFLHGTDYGRASLACDVVEEFRFLADGLALTLVNKKILGRGDFEAAEGGAFFMTRRAREIFYRQYENRISRETTHGDASRGYRRIFVCQAEHLARVLEDREPAYRPFGLR